MNVIELFSQTFRAEGPDATEQIRSAEESIRAFGDDKWFVECLLDIMVRQDVPIPVRNSVTIYLMNMISEHWNAGMRDESKAVVLSNQVRVMHQTLQTMYKTVMKLTIALVNATFSQNQWPGMFAAIEEGFRSQDPNGVTVALMLSKALSIQYRDIGQEMMANHATVSATLLGHLTQFITASGSFFQMGMAFQIARHFSMSTAPVLFQQNTGLLGVWFEKAMHVGEPSTDPHFGMFARCAVRFCSEYFFRYSELIPNEVAVNIMNAIISITNQDTPNDVLGRCVQFLKCALRVPATWTSIRSDLPSFVRFVILPMYALDDNDLTDAENDPTEFLQNFHAQSLDTSDPRSYLFQTIHGMARDSPELCGVCGSMVEAFIGQTDPAFDTSKYSACHVFSAVAEFVHPGTVCSLLPLLGQRSFIVRAGALVALREMSQTSPEVIIGVMKMLQDEMSIVRYFAAVAVASLLEKVDEAQIAVVQQICAPELGGIVRCYFALAQEFQGYRVMGFIKAIVKFFGHHLQGSGVSFVVETYKIYLQSGCTASGGVILSSIAMFMELIRGEHELANHAGATLLAVIFETFSRLPPVGVRDVTELLTTLVAVAPVITEQHWRLFDLLASVQFDIREEACSVYKNLMIRDPATTKKQSTVESLMCLVNALLENSREPRDMRSAMSFISTILVLVREDAAVVPEAFIQRAVRVAVDGFRFPVTLPYATILFGALMIWGAGTTLPMLCSDTPSLFGTWLDSSGYSILLAVSTLCHSFLDDSQLVPVLVRCVQSLYEHLRKLESDSDVSSIDSDTGLSVCSLKTFDEKRLISQLASVIQVLENSRLPGITDRLNTCLGCAIGEVFARLVNIIT